MIVAAFGPGDRRALFDTHDDDVGANLAHHDGAELRDLGKLDPPAANLLDKRLWAEDRSRFLTLAEFDAACPGCDFVAPEPSDTMTEGAGGGA